MTSNNAAPARPAAPPPARVAFVDQIVAIRLCAMANTAGYFAGPIATAERVDDTGAAALYPAVHLQLWQGETTYREKGEAIGAPKSAIDALNIDTATYSADQIARVRRRLEHLAGTDGEAAAARALHAELERAVEQLLAPLASDHPLRGVAWIAPVPVLARLAATPLIHYLTVHPDRLEVQQRLAALQP